MQLGFTTDPNILSYQTSASERNAEWEVGSKNSYEVDDERSLKR